MHLLAETVKSNNTFPCSEEKIILNHWYDSFIKPKNEYLFLFLSTQIENDFYCQQMSVCSHEVQL